MAEGFKARIKKAWTAYKNVAAVRGFLQWVGWWQTTLALLTAAGVWLWTHFAHLRGPEQFVLVLVAFTAMLVLIKLVLWLFDRSKYEAVPLPLPTEIQTETLPDSRPQLQIVRWGQIDEATLAAHNKAPHIVQHGFFIRNFGLGEPAIGVRVALNVPTEVPDVWTSGEGSAPAIIIGKNEEAFVLLWRKLGGTLLGYVLSRFDLRLFLTQTFQGKFGNQEIPVTIRYSSNGKNYLTTQNLIFSQEQRDIVGFGAPEQSLEAAEIGASPVPSSLVTIVGEIEYGQFTMRGERTEYEARTYCTNIRLKMRLTCKDMVEATVKKAALTISIAGKTYSGVNTDVSDLKKRPDLLKKIEARPIRQGVGTIGYLEFFVEELKASDSGITADVSVSLLDEYDTAHVIRNKSLRIA